MISATLFFLVLLVHSGRYFGRLHIYFIVWILFWVYYFIDMCWVTVAASLNLSLSSQLIENN
jgi:hypothetical protein